VTDDVNNLEQPCSLCLGRHGLARERATSHHRRCVGQAARLPLTYQRRRGWCFRPWHKRGRSSGASRKAYLDACGSRSNTCMSLPIETCLSNC
jgi:hypothetical protein